MKYLQEVQERLSKTSPGKWVALSGGGYISVGIKRVCEILDKKSGSNYGSGLGQDALNYQFIASAHQDVEVLLNVIYKVQAELQNSNFRGHDSLISSAISSEILREFKERYEHYEGVSYIHLIDRDDPKICVVLKIDRSMYISEFMGLPVITRLESEK